MKPQKKPRWIVDLTGRRGIRKLNLYRLRLAEGVTVHSLVEESGFDAKFLSLRFAGKDGTEHTVLFDDDIDLSGLPFAFTSLRVLARGAANPMQGLNLQNLGARIFGAAIDKYAKVEITRGIDVTTRKEVIRLSLTIKNFATSAICAPEELNGFVVADDERDPERGGEEQ